MTKDRFKDEVQLEIILGILGGSAVTLVCVDYRPWP